MENRYNDKSFHRDELVIETPMLFEAEESDDDQQEQQKGIHTNSFAIDDGFEEEEEEDDDDFEDFADFEGEAITSNNTKKYKKKD